MGLDCSHDAWSGSYGYFKAFREAVREAAGIDLAEWIDELNELISCGRVREDLQGQYYGWVPDDNIKYLLAHSDCDGYLWPRQSFLVAERLEQLLPALDDTEPRSMRYMAQRFAIGCYRAAAMGEPVEFS